LIPIWLTMIFHLSGWPISWIIISLLWCFCSRMYQTLYI